MDEGKFSRDRYCVCGLETAWGGIRRSTRPPAERIRVGALWLLRCTRCKRWRTD